MIREIILLIFDVLQLIDHNEFQVFVFLLLQHVNDFYENQAIINK